MKELFSPYLRLIRLDKPVGIFLLLWPCWWSLALASHGFPPLFEFVLFAIGAVVMRGAGCVVNDIADREFDKHVERTRNRPLASGELTVEQAIKFLLLLLCIALVIVLCMNGYVFLIAAISLIFVASYPFMKRITWWPQAFLGITFNIGALMGWVALKGELGMAAVLLYLGGIFWTLGYDTIYAHQDKDDDIKIGVKSTALILAGKSRQWIAGFYMAAYIFWAMAGVAAGSGALYFSALFVVIAHMGWQVAALDINDPANCLKIFRSNTILGLLMFIALIL